MSDALQGQYLDPAPAALTSGQMGRLAINSARQLVVSVDGSTGTGRQLTDAGVWAYGDIVVPSDGTDLTNAPARGLYVVTAGDIKFAIVASDGTTRVPITMTFAAKDVVPFAVYRVYATGTTVAAGGIVAGF